MGYLVLALSQRLGRIVLDKTELMVDYDFTLPWPIEQSLIPVFKGTGANRQGTDEPAEPSGPALFAVLHEKLGVELRSQRTPMQIVFIAHVELLLEN